MAVIVILHDFIHDMIEHIVLDACLLDHTFLSLSIRSLHEDLELSSRGQWRAFAREFLSQTLIGGSCRVLTFVLTHTTCRVRDMMSSRDWIMYYRVRC